MGSPEWTMGIVKSSLTADLALPIGILGLFPLFAAFAIAAKNPGKSGSTHIKLSHPTELLSALGYGVLLAALFLLLRAAAAWFGQAGLYALSIVSGLADVDAVSISLAQAASNGLPASVATHGITLAVVANTVMKVFLAFALGGRALGRWCAIILFPAIAMSLSLYVLF